MTRVELRYDIEKPFSHVEYERLSSLTSVYGIMGIRLKLDAAGVTIEYDATRLNPDGVDHILKTNGLAVARAV